MGRGEALIWISGTTDASGAPRMANLTLASKDNDGVSTRVDQPKQEGQEMLGGAVTSCRSNGWPQCWPHVWSPQIRPGWLVNMLECCVHFAERWEPCLVDPTSPLAAPGR